MTAQLTIVVTTRNDAARLNDFFANIRHAREIIVVDRSSTDNTADIAREHNAYVVTQPELSSVQECRRIGTEIAAHEWVLYMTPDERLSEGALDVLHGLLTMSPPEISAWRIRVLRQENRPIATEEIDEVGLRLIRAEDACWDSVQSETSGLPFVAHDVAPMPEDLDVSIASTRVSSLFDAINEMNARTTKATTRAASRAQTHSLIRAMQAGVERFNEQFENDGAESFAYGFLAMSADVMVQAKTLESIGWENDVFLPARKSVVRAWAAFFETLSAEELERVRQRTGRAKELGATERDCVLTLEMATQFWGESPQLLCDLACHYFDAGDLEGAMATARAGLHVEPQHAGLQGIFHDVEKLLISQKTKENSQAAPTSSTSTPERPMPTADQRFRARPEPQRESQSANYRP